MKEKNLHPIVVKYLLEEKECLVADRECGHHYVGKADAFGIKDVGGEYSSNVIGYAVEVKPSLYSFGKNLGQALGYSLFSHRCYLAVPERFDKAHIEMANRLGVGLIEIDTNNDKCVEILTAQHHEPIEDLFLYVVNMSLDYVKCTICKEFFNCKDLKYSKRRPSIVRQHGKHYYYYSERENERIFFTKQKTRYRYPLILCPDCLKELEYGD